jgi:hypothetical protein
VNWLTIALIGAVLVGSAAGTALIVRNPTFWYDMAAAAVVAAMPFFMKRMKPDEEAAWREAQKQGRGDEWMRKRLGLPPKG